MADHAELVSELAIVERMTMTERLKHAKKKRANQLKKYSQLEKQAEKEAKVRKDSKKLKQAKDVVVKFSNSIVLLEAAARNDLAEVRSLLEQKVDPNVANSDGLTALHQCCIDNFDEMVILLVSNGAKVNAEDSESWTPLHAAATCGHPKICQFLINKGANLLAVNADGNMPYDICEDDETLDIIENEMATRGITQNLIDETRLLPETKMMEDVKALAAAGENLEAVGPQGETLLHVAAANGYISLVEFLLEKGVTIETRDNDGWQPLHAAAFWGHLPVVELLVSHGADLETARTASGESPLELCSDTDMRQRLVTMRDEIKSKGVSHLSGVIKRRHSSTHRNQSVKKTMTSSDKKALSHKEAQQEALLLRKTASDEENYNDEEDYKDENHGDAPVTNIDSAVMANDKSTSSLNGVQVHIVSSPVNGSKKVNLLNTGRELTSPRQAESALSIDEHNKSAPVSVPSPNNVKNNSTTASEVLSNNALSSKSHRDSVHKDSILPDSTVLSEQLDNDGTRISLAQIAKPGGTLADLKKRRSQQNQLSHSGRRNSLQEEQPNGLNSPQNNAVSTLPIGDPPKHRFTAPAETGAVAGNGVAKHCCIVM